MLRIGLLDHPLLPGVEANPDTAAAVSAAGTLLEQMGHQVERSHPEAMGDPAFTQAFLTVLAADLATDLSDGSRSSDAPSPATTWKQATPGSPGTAGRSTP